MKNRFLGPIMPIIVLLLVAFIFSKVIPAVESFFEWFFITKEEMSAPLTTGQVIIIDIITHLITYYLVGVLFELSGKWNKRDMHYVSLIISEAVSLGLAVMLRFIIDYYWVLFILWGIFAVALGIVFIKTRKNTKAKEDKISGN